MILAFEEVKRSSKVPVKDNVCNTRKLSTLTGVDLSRYHLVDVYEERYPTTGQGHKIELEIDHFSVFYEFQCSL